MAEMMDSSECQDLEVLRRSLKREKARRQQAEMLLEEKSRELYALNQSLEKRVEERTLELEISRDKALEASRAKSQFLANMSHEIRTPLNGILGFSELIKLQDEEMSQDLSQNISDIHLAACHLAEVINNILDFSKIESGKVSLSVEDLDLKTLLQNAIQITKPQWEEKQIRMTLNWSPAISKMIQGDRSKLHRIFLNLLGNAIKYTGKGGYVQVLVCIKDSELEVEIRDSGIGIPADKMVEIFLPFEQVDNSTTRQYDGTGLGLAISRKLAETMGGDLRAESEVGQGSSFFLMLPYVQGQDVVESLPEPSAVPNYQGQQVLIIEDNPINQRVLSQILVHMGFEVQLATHGKEGLEILEKQDFDLLILDLHMPEMDGREVLMHLKQHSSHQNLPIVVCSAEAFKDRQLEVIALGANAFVAKPVSVSELMSVLSEVMVARSVEEASCQESDGGWKLWSKGLADKVRDIPFSKPELIADIVELEMESAPPKYRMNLEKLLDKVYHGDEVYYREVLDLV